MQCEVRLYIHQRVENLAELPAQELSPEEKPDSGCPGLHEYSVVSVGKSSALHDGVL